MKKCFLLITLLFFIVPFWVNSQDFGLTGDSVNVEIIPISPRAYQSVNVTLTSYLEDIDGALITWQIDGKTVTSGRGVKNFSFSVGNNSRTTALDIIIVFQSGKSARKNIRIKPSDIDLVWQSESFTPPFYKGKKMFSHENKLSIIAVPHMTDANGVEINPKNLTYKWTRSGNVVSEASGYGKNTYTFKGPLISRAQDITVEVTSPNHPGLRGFARFNLPPIEPELVFYTKNPLYGIEFQKAIVGEVNLDNSKEITLVGMPYYFGVLDSSSSELIYKWAINGAPTGLSSGNVQTFRQKEGASGIANISLSIENSQKILQFASSKFSLRFGEQVQQNSLF